MEKSKVSKSEIARHLDLSRVRVAGLVADGVLKSRNGTFDLDESRVSYIRFLRDREVRSAKSDDLRASRQRLIETKIIREQETMKKEAIDIALSMSEEFMAKVCGQAGLAPSRVHT